MAGFNDWLTVTDPRVMAEALAEQFRLSQNELQKASEALAPAFAIGLQRAMSDPNAWTGLSRAFTAMTPAGIGSQQTTAGPAFLDAFFRSDALVAAVARQASLFAGIAPDTMQKLMPGLAMLTMDKMVRATMDTIGKTQPAGLATGDFGGAAAEMMRRGANAVEALSRPSDATKTARTQGPPNPFAQNPMADAFTEALKTGFGWFAKTPDSPAAATAPSHGPAKDAERPAEVFNPILPFAMMMEAFAKGVTSKAEDNPVEGRRPAEAPKPAEAKAAPHAAPAPPTAKPKARRPDVPAKDADLVGELMRSGQKIRDDYAREMAALFERYQGEMKVN